MTHPIRSFGLLAVLVLAAFAAGGCVARRPVVSPPAGTPMQPGPVSRAGPARSLTWMDYRHTANNSVMGLKVTDGKTEYAGVFTGTSLQLGSGASDWFLPEGNAYLSGPFPKAGAARAWWTLLISHNISIGVEGTTVLFENPPQPAKPRVERVYLIDAPVDEEHAVEIVDLASNVKKARLSINGYMEFRIDNAGNRTFAGPYALPTDPNDPKYKFIESMKQAATDLRLR